MAGRPRRLPLALAFSLLVVAGTSRAPATAHADSYRLQVLAADLGSDALFLGSVYADAGVATRIGAGVGVAGAVAGAPLIHFLHGDNVEGFVSLGVRVGVVGLSALWYRSWECGDDDGKTDGVIRSLDFMCGLPVLAGVGGLLIMQIVDSAFLSSGSDDASVNLVLWSGSFR